MEKLNEKQLKWWIRDVCLFHIFFQRHKNELDRNDVYYNTKKKKKKMGNKKKIPKANRKISDSFVVIDLLHKIQTMYLLPAFHE